MSRRTIATDTASEKHNRPLRIAFVDMMLKPDQPGASGLSDIVWNMARELARLGDDVHIVAPYTVEPAPFPGITVHRFPIPPIGYRNVIGHVLIVLRAWRQLRQIPGLDVIHAPEYLSTGIIARLTKIPVVLTTPGNIYERIANGNPYDWTMTQALKLAARSSARRCLLIDAISADMKRWWERTGAPPERVVVIPHGVDLETFHPVPDARTRLGLDPNVPVLLYVGRLSPEKQVDVLLRAVGDLATTHTFHLHIVGDGSDIAPLQAQTEQLGLARRVTFHGQRLLSELPLWYSAANAVILPSRSEGLPRVMLEALACGSLFIGTRISGVRDHIVDGETGFIVDSNDGVALSQRLRTILNDPSTAHAVAMRGQGYAADTLSWEKVVRHFRKVITEYLNRGFVHRENFRR